MAIITCPQCSNKISDKNKECPHCQLDMSELSEEKLQSLSKIKKLQNNQTIMTHQAIAMLLFLAGVFGTYNLADKESLEYKSAVASMVVGFAWYIFNRFRMLINKRKG